MDQHEFADAMLRRGCVGSEKTFCGTYNNYPFTAVFLSGKSGRQTQFQLQMQFTEKLPKRFIKDINLQLPRKKRVAPVQGGAPTLLSVNVLARNNADLEQMLDDLLERITRQAAAVGLTLPVLCPVCRTGNCDSYAYYAGSYRPAHAACVQNSSAAAQMEAATNIRHGSYLSGFVGAILGGLVGAIPTIIFMAMGYIVALLCALIPLAAYQGYKLFGGRMTKAVLAPVLLVSVLLVPVIHYMDVAIYGVINGYGLLPVSDYVTFALEAFSGVILEMLQILLFVAIGVFFVYGKISRTGHEEIRDAAFSAATLRPLFPAVATAAAPQPEPGAFAAGPAE